MLGYSLAGEAIILSNHDEMKSTYRLNMFVEVKQQENEYKPENIISK